MLSTARPAAARRPVHVMLVAVGVAGYLGLVYVTQILTPNQSAFPIWVTEIWNYGFAAVALGLIHVATLRVNRPEPQIPTGARAFGRLALVLLLAGVLIVLFWLAVITRWPPFWGLAIFD